MDEAQWPITMEQFQELDRYLADHLPRLRVHHQWEMIRHYYRDMKRERKEEMERWRERASQVRRALFV